MAAWTKVARRTSTTTKAAKTRMTNKGEMGQPHDSHGSPRRSLDDGPPLKKSKALPASYSDEEEREERRTRDVLRAYGWVSGSMGGGV